MNIIWSWKNQYEIGSNYQIIIDLGRWSAKLSYFPAQIELSPVCLEGAKICELLSDSISFEVIGDCNQSNEAGVLKRFPITKIT